MQTTTQIPTSKGSMTIPEIFDTLSYSSYAANRGYGMSHDQLLKIGLGNDKMKEAYERSLANKKQ